MFHCFEHVLALVWSENSLSIYDLFSYCLLFVSYFRCLVLYIIYITISTLEYICMLSLRTDTKEHIEKFLLST
jgi:hypothetical protein